MRVAKSPNTPLIDQLLADIRPQSSYVVVKTRSATLTFRTVADAAEMRRLTDICRTFADSMAKKSAHPEWRDLTPMDREYAGRVALIAELSAEPRLSPLDVAKIARTNGLFFSQVCEAIDNASRVDATIEYSRELEYSKNASGGIPSGETG